MRISLKWLSEYVDLDISSGGTQSAPPGSPLAPARPHPAAPSLATVEELARRLTAVGLEVEAIERLGQGLSGVVAVRVLTSEKHPNAEKLSVTTVDRGDGAPLQIVCGAKNYRVGDLVPLATVGATLPGGMTIEKAKLRGVESFGMLCSARELGLDADASGLLILPPEVKPGTPVGEALGLEDVLFEINVTPNRPDALSHLGMAREVAAVLGRPLKHPGAAPKESGAPAAEAVAVRIEAPEKCARYAARVIEGVTIGPSPLWLQRRLEVANLEAYYGGLENGLTGDSGGYRHDYVSLTPYAGMELPGRVVATFLRGRATVLDGKLA